MTTIGSINGVSGATLANGAAASAREAALGTIGEIGHRVLAWVGASGGSGDPSAWAAATGSASGFQADLGSLAGGGDIYGLGELAHELSSRFGGTPAQEGALRRSLEDFTREAVIQVAGLSGGSADGQVAGLRDALDAAGAQPGSAGSLDDLGQRLDTATATLAGRNGR